MLVIGVMLLYSLWRILKTILPRPGSIESDATGNVRRARTRDLLILIAGACTNLILVTGFFVSTLPLEFVRQVYLFHFFRPADGVIAVGDRFNEILSSQGSHLTIYFAAGGIAIILLRGILQNDWGHWGLVILWVVGALGIVIVAKTFYLHYVLQALVPLAILGGALVSRSMRDSSDVYLNERRAWLRVSQIGIFIIFALTNLTTAGREIEMALEVPLLRSHVDLRPLRRFLADNTSPNAVVLGFEPIYALVASRQPAGITSDTFMVDSYGYLLYKNSGMDKNFISTVSRSDVSETMLARRGQEEIVGIAQRADYVIIDDRAWNQLTLASLTQILLDRSQIFQSGQVSVYGPIFSKP